MTTPQSQLRMEARIRAAVFVLLCMAIGAGGLAFLHYLRPVLRFVLNVLSPFFVALIVAYMFNPMVGAIEKRFRLGRTAGVLAAYTVILLITAAFFAVLLPILYVQLRDFVAGIISRVPAVARQVGDWLHLRVTEDDIARLREAAEGRLDMNKLAAEAGPVAKLLVQRIATVAGVVASFALSAVSVTVGFLAFVAFVVLITFYFLLDYGRIGRAVALLLPPARRERFFDVWRRVDAALGAYLRGQLVVCVILATAYTIVLMLLGMKSYAVLLGFCAGFGNLIPYLGPIIGGVPAALWVIFGDAYPATHDKAFGVALVALFSVAVQSVDGFVLQPRIVGRNAGLHPLLVILALFVGAQFGLGGLIIAVPAAVIARVLVVELWWRPLAARRAADDGQAWTDRNADGHG